MSSNFRATVVWTDPATGGQHSQDVLVLAGQAVNDWQTFFSSVIYKTGAALSVNGFMGIVAERGPAA